ncbi:AAA family ATPase [Sphaerimonospora sp. CA-214678]|uniref:AAA family ATPase n=1 Tax=Sphaerimonospora sp. CA-214678 TaxID=3240029 RepID=UPI003D8DBE5E
MLDDGLLDRDEVWFTEKDDAGATSLYSLAEFRPRKDENIERGYLQGPTVLSHMSASARRLSEPSHAIGPAP